MISRERSSAPAQYQHRGNDKPTRAMLLGQRGRAQSPARQRRSIHENLWPATVLMGQVYVCLYINRWAEPPYDGLLTKLPTFRFENGVAREFPGRSWRSSFIPSVGRQLAVGLRDDTIVTAIIFATPRNACNASTTARISGGAAIASSMDFSSRSMRAAAFLHIVQQCCFQCWLPKMDVSLDPLHVLGRPRSDGTHTAVKSPAR
jgi:hypothetical protein